MRCITKDEIRSKKTGNYLNLTHAQHLVLLCGIIVLRNLKLISQTENHLNHTGDNLLFYCIQCYNQKAINDKEKLFSFPFILKKVYFIVEFAYFLLFICLSCKQAQYICIFADTSSILYLGFHFVQIPYNGSIVFIPSEYEYCIIPIRSPTIKKKNAQNCLISREKCKKSMVGGGPILAGQEITWPGVDLRVKIFLIGLAFVLQLYSQYV